MSSSASRTTVRVSEVRLGDRLLAPTGEEMTVTRIDTRFLGRTDFRRSSRTPRSAG